MWFEWLRRRPKDEPATLPVYMVFDLLELDGRGLRRDPLRARRRQRLERIIGGHGMIFAACNDGFMGAAPDLGCCKLGQPLPHYDPRP